MCSLARWAALRWTSLRSNHHRHRRAGEKRENADGELRVCTLCIHLPGPACLLSTLLILCRALLSHPRVLCTPHLGASTEEAQRKVAREIAGQMSDAFLGRGYVGVVNASHLALLAQVREE
jgi:hypothetical protein